MANPIASFKKLAQGRVGNVAGEPARGSSTGRAPNFYQDLSTQIARIEQDENYIDMQIARIQAKDHKVSQSIEQLMKNPTFTKRQVSSTLNRLLAEQNALRNHMHMLEIRHMKATKLRTNMMRIQLTHRTADDYNAMIATCQQYESETSEGAIRSMQDGARKFDEHMERNAAGLDTFQHGIEESVGADINTDHLDEQGMQQLQELSIDTDMWGVNAENAVQQEKAAYMQQWEDMQAQRVGDTISAPLYESPAERAVALPLLDQFK